MWLEGQKETMPKRQRSSLAITRLCLWTPCLDQIIIMIIIIITTTMTTTTTTTTTWNSSCYSLEFVLCFTWKKAPTPLLPCLPKTRELYLKVTFHQMSWKFRCFVLSNSVLRANISAALTEQKPAGPEERQYYLICLGWLPRTPSKFTSRVNNVLTIVEYLLINILNWSKNMVCIRTSHIPQPTKMKLIIMFPLTVHLLIVKTQPPSVPEKCNNILQYELECVSCNFFFPVQTMLMRFNATLPLI